MAASLLYRFCMLRSKCNSRKLAFHGVSQPEEKESKYALKAVQSLVKGRQLWEGTQSSISKAVCVDGAGVGDRHKQVSLLPSAHPAPPILVIVLLNAWK